MPSIFNRDPGDPKQPSAYARDRIEAEIAHLKKRKPVRDARQTSQMLGAWVSVLLVLALFVLFFMDPVLHSIKRGDAIHAYLYLHGYGSDAKAQALAATGILTANEVDLLNHRQGAFQDLFPSPGAADAAADDVIRYMKGVENLHSGHDDRLDWLGKIRYQLFMRWGLSPPTEWDFLNPSVNI
jgi:hypothetical protein